jgi:hypothetical protein
VTRDPSIGTLSRKNAPEHIMLGELFRMVTPIYILNADVVFNN